MNFWGIKYKYLWGFFVYICIVNIYPNLSQMAAMPSGDSYFGGCDMNAKELTVLMVEPNIHPMVANLAIAVLG